MFCNCSLSLKAPIAIFLNLNFWLFCFELLYLTSEYLNFNYTIWFSYFWPSCLGISYFSLSYFSIFYFYLSQFGLISYFILFYFWLSYYGLSYYRLSTHTKTIYPTCYMQSAHSCPSFLIHSSQRFLQHTCIFYEQMAMWCTLTFTLWPQTWSRVPPDYSTLLVQRVGCLGQNRWTSGIGCLVADDRSISGREHTNPTTPVYILLINTRVIF